LSTPPVDTEPAPTASATEPGTAALPKLRRALTNLHVRLRTEGGSPRRRAAAVALGTMIGCTPFYGLHLALCTVLARLLRLSRILTYLAAHLNNPLTAPLLLYAEQGLGHWLLTGDWPDLSMAHFRQQGLLGTGVDLLLGSLVLGPVLASLAGLATWVVARRRSPHPFDELRTAAAEPYLGAGVVHWEWVRGKLRYDPFFRGVLEAGLLPRPGRLVDLGCGRGILLSLLAVLDEADPEGSEMELAGVELRPSLVAVARSALAGKATVEQGDLAAVELAACDTVVLIDVLHYLPAAAQARLLEQVAAALAPGGLLLLREADAEAGWRFAVTRAAERCRALARGHLRQHFCYRGGDELHHRLEELGLAVDRRPMQAGTPFGNVLLAARKAAPAAAAGRGGLSASADSAHRQLERSL
jgi:uncharacterized protein (DUF2062 family)